MLHDAATVELGIEGGGGVLLAPGVIIRVVFCRQQCNVLLSSV